MNCKEFREILDLYVDQELSAQALATAQIHVNKCPACRRAEQQLLKLKHALQVATLRHNPPPDLVTSVRSITEPRWRKLLAIRDRNADGVVHRELWWRRNIRIPVPAFALLLVSALIFGFLFLRATLAGRSQQQPNRAAAIKSTQIEASVAATDLSSFDHGGRATLYKASR